MTNSGLPAVRSWIRRAPSASSAARADLRRELRGLGHRETRRGPCRSTPGHDAQAGGWPGRIPASTTIGRRGGPLDQDLDHPGARGIHPVQVVDDDRPGDRAVSMIRSMYRPATSSSVAVTAAWSAGMSGASASQPENAASRAIAAIAPPNRLPTSGLEVGREEHRPGERARNPCACSSADRLREDAREPVWLGLAVGGVLGPGPGQAAGACASSSISARSRVLPMPASPTTRNAPPRPVAGAPLQERADPAPTSDRGRRAGR